MVIYKKYNKASVRQWDHCYSPTKLKTFLILITFVIPLLFIAITFFISFPPINGQINDKPVSGLEKQNETQIGNIFDPRYTNLVNFTSKIDQIHGHLNASLMNKYDGNETLVVAHAAHPVAEIYPLIAPQIANANKSLDQSLYSILVNLPEVSKNSTNEEYANVIQSTKNVLKKIVNEVIPRDLQNDLMFNSFVVVNLLDTAGHEYQEAITNNTITAMVEYQDSQAFLQQAEKLLTSLHSLNQSSSLDSHNFIPLLSSLNSSIVEVSNPKDVYMSINKIFQEISSISGLDKFTLLSKLGKSNVD